MKLLLVAATVEEIGPFLDAFHLKEGLNTLAKVNVTVLITGVGMVATAYATGTALACERFDLAINAGIAGSFDPSLPFGLVVNVNKDSISELGAEDNDRFVSIDELGFGLRSQYPLPFTRAISSVSSLPEVSAITVNTVHGCQASIKSIRERLNPQIESMEGAAFFYACSRQKLPSVQIRAISNRVEPRCRENWNIPLAVGNLNKVLTDLVNEFL